MLLVRRSNDRVVMVRDSSTVASAPIRELSHVSAHGPVTFTGAALAGLMDAGIDVTLYSSGGRWRGLISSARSGNVFLLLAQADGWRDEAKKLAIARALVASKIAGQRQLLQRKALDRGSIRCDDAAQRLAVYERQVWEQGSVDAVRGIEGAAAAAYFDVFDEMLSGGWRFPGRVRHPATDPVNALLSFGYVLAVGEIVRALVQRGFDSRIGFLHGLRYGRESLALDLVEEFRSPMVDRFTLRLLNRGQFVAEDFEPHEDGAVRLTRDARRKFLELWEDMLSARAAEVRKEAPLGADRAQLAARVSAVSADDVPAQVDDRPVPDDDAAEQPITWRRRIERQVLRLWRTLMYAEAFVPLTAGPSGGTNVVTRASNVSSETSTEAEASLKERQNPTKQGSHRTRKKRKPRETS
jgi:CRISPR-associated protein Cas1